MIVIYTAPAPEVLCFSDDMEIAFNRTIHPSLQEDHLSIRDIPANCVTQKTTNESYIAIRMGYNNCAAKTEVILYIYYLYIYISVYTARPALVTLIVSSA